MVPRCSARRADRPRARVARFHEHEAVEIRAQVPFVAGPGVEEAPRVVAVRRVDRGEDAGSAGQRGPGRPAPPPVPSSRGARGGAGEFGGPLPAGGSEFGLRGKLERIRPPAVAGGDVAARQAHRVEPSAVRLVHLAQPGELSVELVRGYVDPP